METRLTQGDNELQPRSAAEGRVFTTTHWSMVLAAGSQQSHEADEALEKLCRTYWPPIYVFLRRSGCTAHDAEDLTQAFFERVLGREYLRAADRTKGRFRTFLLAMLRHFIANQRRDARALKRGGRIQFVCLDELLVDGLEPAAAGAEVTPEQSFDQQWAMTLLQQVVVKLQHEYSEAGKTPLFDGLKPCLTGEVGAALYGDLGRRLGMTEAALKMSASRMRRRYGELLRAEIARTVSTAADAEEELKALFAALR